MEAWGVFFLYLFSFFVLMPLTLVLGPIGKLFGIL